MTGLTPTGQIIFALKFISLVQNEKYIMFCSNEHFLLLILVDMGQIVLESISKTNPYKLKTGTFVL